MDLEPFPIDAAIERRHPPSWRPFAKGCGGGTSLGAEMEGLGTSGRTPRFPPENRGLFPFPPRIGRNAL
jgi:hypothetical protein